MTDEATRHNEAVYDRIAPLYAQRHTGQEGWFADLREAFAARLPQVADIADLGCGPAQDARIFARAGHRVVGVDRSAVMLGVAARAMPGRLAQSDLRRLPLADGSVDGVWCCAALLHIPHGDTAAVLAETWRVLRPGGCFALVTAAGGKTALEPVPYAPAQRRWFFYRQAGDLREQLLAARLAPLRVSEEAGSRRWIKILAARA